MSDPNWPPPAPPQYAGSQSQAVSGDYASWGLRVGAAIIDGIIVTVILLGLLAAAGSTGDDGAVGAGAVIAYVVAYLYAPLMMMRKGEHNGQTLGKQAVDIRVKRDNGEEFGFWYAALREILIKGLIGPLTLGIDYLWPLWDKRNQALHDKIVGTYVIDT